jgi:diguanylate cyclase (GGDEF)-like protein/PAS domain S-box-containing protein
MKGNEQTRAIAEALQICADEPIHLIGSIQPVGVLLAVDRSQFVIRAASANLDSIFPLSAAVAIGRSLRDLVGGDQMNWFEILKDMESFSGANVGALTLVRDGQERKYDTQVFLSGDLFVIEIEQAQPPAGDVFQELFIPVRDALWKLDSETDLARYSQMAVEQVRVLTGFDRVMMYRFDNNWDGEVIAESKTEDSDSYLGNRFPAADIPPQARELYTRNLVRIIADVDAEQIPIVGGTGQKDATAIDLSHSWLRSLSPVHVEYLRNMGVRASLSISLVQNNRLWGLIACHNFTPRYVGLRAREMDEFIARVVSLKLINMDTDERESMGRRIRELLDEMTRLIRGSDDLDAIIHLLKDKLLGLVRAVGAVFTIDGIRHAIGETPPASVVDRLEEALRHRPESPVFHTDDLAHQVVELEDLAAALQDRASGIMAAPLDRRMKNFVMWFRPGIMRTLRWAGNPEKTLVRDTSGVRISPRTSFETWIQTYRDKSLPWSQVEVDAANSLSLALIEVLAHKALRSSEESYRLLAENSTDMIARLDLDGRFHFASPACLELFGLDSAKIVGKCLSDVVDETPDVIRLMLTSLKPLGAVNTRMLRRVRQDRGEVWIEATLKHSLGSQGQHEILLNARNVTQRYNYQLAIEDVHRRHTKILEAAGEGLISIDSRGRVIYANEVATRILARDEQAMIGQLCCEVFCWEPAGQGHSACPFLDTVRDGETRQGTRRLHPGDDRSLLQVDYVCTPLVDNGAITGAVIVFTESEHQSGTEHDMATEAILDQTMEAVMVTDANGRISSVNRAFTEITGYSQDEALGQTPRLIKSGVHTPHFYVEMWKVLEETGRWCGEIWNRRRNGEIYPQWGSISAVLDGNGKVKNYVAVFSDISKAKQAEEKLFHLANHDTLTGLPNRLNFTEHLANMLERCKRGESGAAVVFIDLDRFKIINDTLGHAVGDKYLKTVSDRLLSATRKQDLLGRWGGDEFVLAMQDIRDPRLITEALSRMQMLLAEPIHLAGHELIPTASIGAALYPVDGRKSSDLIQAADAAMYRAKERGRNCIEFYATEMSRDLETKLTLSSELHHAFQENQFFLAYQPQVDPRDRALKGVEALVRWRHPVRGVLAPGEFLATLEEIGLMGNLGTWVLGEACRQMREWNDSGVPIPRVSINVAPSQLKEAFVATVAAALESSGIAPAQLELEITEGALEAGQVAQHITEGLRDLGVMLAVDDFGTGYSSLAHIKLFPITCFKIDKSFVDGVPGNAADVAIVRTILALGSSFKVEIVAEGAETLDQVDFLRGEGVTNIQGYFFGRPMTPELILQWLQSRQTG